MNFISSKGFNFKYEVHIYGYNLDQEEAVEGPPKHYKGVISGFFWAKFHSRVEKKIQMIFF